MGFDGRLPLVRSDEGVEYRATNCVKSVEVDVEESRKLG